VTNDIVIQILHDEEGTGGCSRATLREYEAEGLA
jgi:hypothetical protein